jgi:outer membrane receptor protein involved in Fe transport
MVRYVVAAVMVCAALLAAAPLPAFGQAGRSEINGTVFDADKAVIPGATITVTEQGTGLVRTTVSGGDGRFVIPTLTPGTYTIAVELPGFQTATRQDLALAVGQELTLDFTLPLATVQEQVTVTGEAPVVEVTTSRVGTNVTNREIDSLPSQGRNQLSLMQLVPGLTPSLQPGTFEGGQFNANGRDTGSNLFMVDGSYNNDDRLGGSQGTQARVPLDVMSEFQVLTHQYTAEFGGASGVVVNAVTKSGTNDLRGRGYYYTQDDSLNATNYFLKQRGEENPDSGSKNWGFNGGGPIVRNKAFWFGSIERTAIDNAVVLEYPADAAPVAVSYSDTSTIRVWNTFLRGDYQIAPNHNLSGRFLNEAAVTVGEDWQDDLRTRDGVDIENDAGDRTLNGSFTSVLGNRATNEFRVGHVREDLLQGNRQYFDDDFNFIELNGRDQFDIGSDNEHEDWGGGPLALHGNAKVRSYTIDDAFTFVRSGWAGSHTFKAGAGWSQNGANPIIAGSNDNGTFEFLHNRPFDPANALTYPSVFSIRLGQIYFDVTDRRTNAFAQDKWQVNQNLTLNLGVRYDYQTMTPQTKDAVAPRFGVAYDPTGSGRTVIRGGVGKFYEYQLIPVLSELAQRAVISPAFVYETDEDEAPLSGRLPADPCLRPGGNAGLAVISPACRAVLVDVRNRVAAGGFINTEPILDGDRRLGYLWSFSAGVQRELMPNVGLSVDVVANRGRDQTALIDINEPRLLPNGTIGRPGVAAFDPDGALIPAQARAARFQRVLQFQTRDDLNSDYNALEIALDKRYAERWSGRFAYTLSRSRDVGIVTSQSPFGNFTATGGANISTKRLSDDLDPRSDYGRSNFDNRHAVAFSLNANPWGGLGAGAVFRYYSGYPINELVGTDFNADRDSLDRPVRGIHDLTRPIVSAVDANGRAVRNGIDGENLVLLDLRFQYLFEMPREGQLGLFWEIYNAADRANFGNPTGNRRSANFLVPVSVNSPRTMQLGIRYTF